MWCPLPWLGSGSIVLVITAAWAPLRLGCCWSRAPQAPPTPLHGPVVKLSLGTPVGDSPVPCWDPRPGGLVALASPAPVCFLLAAASGSRSRYCSWAGSRPWIVGAVSCRSVISWHHLTAPGRNLGVPGLLGGRNLKLPPGQRRRCRPEPGVPTVDPRDWNPEHGVSYPRVLPACSLPARPSCLPLLSPCAVFCLSSSLPCGLLSALCVAACLGGALSLSGPGPG